MTNSGFTNSLPREPDYSEQQKSANTAADALEKVRRPLLYTELYTLSEVCAANSVSNAQVFGTKYIVGPSGVISTPRPAPRMTECMALSACSTAARGVARHPRHGDRAVRPGEPGGRAGGRGVRYGQPEGAGRPRARPAAAAAAALEREGMCKIRDINSSR